MLTTTLTSLDLMVMAIPLGLVLAVSLFMRRYMRSVADFLAASRCAGRYLISTAMAETGASVMIMIVALEVFSRVGWSLKYWEAFTGIILFFMGLLGIVSYRFRQTRALTFHQFFEIRYSKGVRVFGSFLHAFSGLLSFGVQPAVGARFFVYFCGLPEQLHWGGWILPTFVPIMVTLMAISLFFALTGGQISVMVTDCLENIISSVLYLIIAAFLICTVSLSQVRTAVLSGPAGSSYVDPFDIASRSDFNGWYILFALLLNLYFYRGNAWNQGFSAAAKSPHEGRMAQILGNWRGYSYTTMAALVALGAFTLMHHPDFAAQRGLVEQSLSGVSLTQMKTQMQMPTAIGVLLAPGIRGCFCAVLLFGLLASQGQQLHGYGSTFLQDVFLPCFKKPLDPKQHVRWLKIMVFGVAVFACLFSMWFKPVDYLVLATALLSALYLGGIGLVVWGGLYWKRGTTAGAWTSLSIGAALSVFFFIFQQFWTSLQPGLLALFGPGSAGQYLAAHAEKCPLNGQQLTLITALASGLGYVVVSLFTCREPFNIDAMLHRGKYRIQTDDILTGGAQAKRNWLQRFLQIDEHFTRGDKVLTYATFAWSMFWQLAAWLILLWSLGFGRLSANWWFNYTLTREVLIGSVLAVITTLWFMVGVTRDLKDLLRTLKTVKRIDADDGTVRGHHNLGEEALVTNGTQPAIPAQTTERRNP